MNTKLIPILILCGLMTSPITYASDAGAILGGGVGGAVGAAIGQDMNGRNGAIIGAAIGGATGAAIGTSHTRTTQYHSAPTQVQTRVVTRENVVYVRERDDDRYDNDRHRGWYRHHGGWHHRHHHHDHED